MREPFADSWYLRTRPLSLIVTTVRVGQMIRLASRYQGLPQQSFRFPDSALGASYVGKKHTVSGKGKVLDIRVG